MLNGSVIFLLLFVFLIFYIENKKQKQWANWFINNKKCGGNRGMAEYIKELIGKECIVYLLSGEVSGVIEDVSDKSILVKTKTDTQIINLDFVMRVREYPKNKNGKKKSIVID